jgi:hypothetical protein
MPLTAQYQGHRAARKCVLHLRRELIARRGDLRQVFGLRIALGPRLGLFDGDISQVLHLIPQRFQARIEAGDA